MRTLLVVALVALAACGGDDNGNGARPPAPQGPKPASKPAAAAAVGSGDMHVEDRVACASPEKATGPSCDPSNPTCDDGLYCLPVGNGHNCEPCPEKDEIRHVFSDRDFAPDQTRDPFQSFVIPSANGPGSQENGPKPELTQVCKRPDQLVATGWGYQDLKLVGIVAQGTQRKVLMMAGNKGEIIKKGDCVGKEKAYVKDIGADYITFVVDADPDTNRPASEHSVELYPNGLETEIPTDDAPPGPTSTAVPTAVPSATPVVTPPSSGSAAATKP